MYWKELFLLNLANNKLSGEIPSSIGYLHDMGSLHLNNNNFSGKLPLSLKNCTNLRIIDIGENQLSGNIPLWIGEILRWLTILRLHSNQFNGSIPSQLCQLISLQILDLAQNNITGTIPKCLGNFTAMTSIGDMFIGEIAYNTDLLTYLEKTTVGWKGKDREFKENLRLMKAIDLSSNNLSGKIPTQVMELLGLRVLNLSKNLLTRKIASNIGHMGILEVLDFSSNHLSGGIPIGLSNLSSLNVLNLSQNNLSGEISMGPQLQTFEASSFTNNPELCSSPLSVNCTTSAPSNQVTPVRRDGNGTDISWFYIGLRMGYIVGFWAVCLPLIFRRSWRIAYFHFVDEVEDWMYVVIVVKARKMRRKFGG